jgi:hypothetical protein
VLVTTVRSGWRGIGAEGAAGSSDICADCGPTSGADGLGVLTTGVGGAAVLVTMVGSGWGGSGAEGAVGSSDFCTDCGPADGAAGCGTFAGGTGVEGAGAPAAGETGEAALTGSSYIRSTRGFSTDKPKCSSKEKRSSSCGKSA